MLDKCDHAGIWRVDLEIASVVIGETVTESGAYEHFGERVKFLKEDKWFIPSFVLFQYGKLSENKVSSSVRKILESNKIDPSTLTLTEPLPNPYLWLKDKDKDKDKVKDKDQDKEKAIFDFEILYQKYPLKKGKSEGLARLKNIIKTDEEYQLFSKAIDKYIQVIHRDGTQPQYIKHFSSFVGSGKVQPWLDFTQDDVGTSKIQFTSKTMSAQLPRSHGNLRAMEEALKMVDEEEGVL